MQKTILWIDDSAQERATGEVLLRRIKGLTPVTACSSDEARSVLREKKVDAVVTDIL